MSRRAARTSAKKSTTKLHAKKPSPRTTTAAIGVPALQPESIERLIARSAHGRTAKNPAPPKLEEIDKRLARIGFRPGIDKRKLLKSAKRIDSSAGPAIARLPEEIQKSIPALVPQVKRFHGAKVALQWFPFSALLSPCADKFGYMSPLAVRNATKLPFDLATQLLLTQLGNLMGDPGRDTAPDSTLPAGFTYVGQFVDHDITFDVSSSLDVATDANTVNNMRTPSLDLDSVYGRGPALEPYLYVFPEIGPPTAIKMQLGANRDIGPGGPAGSVGNPGGMKVQTTFDVPRMSNPINPGLSTNTAVIGDPRNDENLIVSQFHHAMLLFHNQVVDLLVSINFPGDIFVEAKKLVIHHYQWAVVNDFLKRICGPAVVTGAFGIPVGIGSPFRMPVEFAVAAYRFGHSMIRDNYWVNFNFTNATLGQVFQFIRNPNLPVLSNWVVDFNAFFDTGVPVPVHNKARKIDSVLANSLESLPGFSGMMAVLAARNLRRGLALGLPSGQGMAGFFGVPAMTPAMLKSGLPVNEVAVLNSNGGVLLSKTPLWYYVLREAAVLGSGNRLGPVGARIVAETFARMLKRDASSFLNVSGGFTPMLPSASPGQFTFADLVTFAGVTQP